MKKALADRTLRPMAVVMRPIGYSGWRRIVVARSHIMGRAAGDCQCRSTVDGFAPRELRSRLDR
jgi:hypothetical protein